MTTAIEQPTQSILLIEDSPEDYESTMRALQKGGITIPVHRCEDGDEGLEFLFRRGHYADPATSPRPEIILLDLNLPGTDGREVLAEVKADPGLRKIPVIVLTTSTDERDIEGCYQSGANSYIRKPVDLRGFMDAIQRLVDYWFEITVLPRPESDI